MAGSNLKSPKPGATSSLLSARNRHTGSCTAKSRFAEAKGQVIPQV
jgi:hypothetical protein